ncbi:hypothetical protein [Mesorhizobium sp.]|uniref:hypothetical protein n=1 Tax=Mesorhizobium sp. TaxID=1871066 RepID=UPI00258099F1|nr:hypothetical protein [Mesorhizobium sp.]
MAKRDRDGHKTLAEAVRELIGTEDNRRHVNKLFGLKVEPAANSSFVAGGDW